MRSSTAWTMRPLSTAGKPPVLPRRLFLQTGQVVEKKIARTFGQRRQRGGRQFNRLWWRRLPPPDALIDRLQLVSRRGGEGWRRDHLSHRLLRQCAGLSELDGHLVQGHVCRWQCPGTHLAQ